MKKIVVLMVLIFIAVPLISFNRVDNSNSQEDWTIMMYMSDHGGDGIEDQLEEDFDNLMNSDPSTSVNVLVLKKVQKNGTLGLYQVEEGTKKIPLSQINETWDQNQSLTDHNVLNQYVGWGMDNFPAESYMLNLWGHGSSLDGMLLEEGGSLNVEDIQKGLENLRLDILGFDACTMGLIENYYQLRDTADIIISSQMEEPVEGWPYDKIMQELNDNPEMEPRGVSKVIVDSFVSWGENNSGVSSSLTAIDTSEIPYLEMNDYFGTLEDYLPYYRGEISDAKNNTERYNPQPEPLDLYHFTMNVEKSIHSQRLKANGRQLRTQINSSVIHHNNYDSDVGSSMNSNGYGFYFSENRIADRYHSLDFYENDFTSWVEHFNSVKVKEEVLVDIEVHKNNTVSIEVVEHLDADMVDVYFIGEEMHMESTTIGEVNYLELPSSSDDYLIETFIYWEDNLLNHTTIKSNEL
ncbi:MAG: clostripain-related cysteine peptidase [Candidatus Saliniplasma sp.]